MDFRKLFQDVLPPDPNQPPVNTVQTQPTPDTGLLQKIGLNDINPFFTRRDPFLTSIIGKEGADRVLGQGTGTGIVTTGLTYGLTGDPFKSYLAGMQSSQKSVDKRKQSIFDMIKYSKDMKEYNLMDYNALPEPYKIFGAMKNDPDFAKYQFAKDMFTKDIKEFEYSRNADGFIDHLKEMAIAKRPTYSTTIGVANKNASDAVFKDIQTERDLGKKAYQGMKSVTRMQDILNSGLETGLGSEIALSLTKPLQLILGKDFNADKLAKLEDFKAITNLVVLPQVKQLGFNPTNVDLAFIEASSPRLINSTQGNLLMLKALEESYIRQDMLATKLDQWVMENEQMVIERPVVAGAMFEQARKKFAEEIIGQRKSYTEALKEEQDNVLKLQEIEVSPNAQDKKESDFYN